MSQMQNLPMTCAPDTLLQSAGLPMTILSPDHLVHQSKVHISHAYNNDPHSHLTNKYFPSGLQAMQLSLPKYPANISQSLIGSLVLIQ